MSSHSVGPNVDLVEKKGYVPILNQPTSHPPKFEWGYIIIFVYRIIDHLLIHTGCNRKKLFGSQIVIAPNPGRRVSPAQRKIKNKVRS